MGITAAAAAAPAGSPAVLGFDSFKVKPITTNAIRETTVAASTGIFPYKWFRPKSPPMQDQQ